jgi:5-aminolevulinate synthase
MLYDQFFSTAIARLHEERCYRVFAELERSAGRLPDATWRSP